jgi:hypothetical protein
MPQSYPPVDSRIMNPPLAAINADWIAIAVLGSYIGVYVLALLNRAIRGIK